MNPSGAQSPSRRSTGMFC